MTDFQQVRLDQKPCYVCYLDEFDTFLIGTYQLYPTLESAKEKFGSKFPDDSSLQQHLDKINQRAGKLYLIHYDNRAEEPTQRAKVEFEYDCSEGGGVFDAVSWAGLDANDKTRIFAAHSNGTIGYYELTRPVGGAYNIEQKNLIRVSEEPSTLLTSITTSGEHNLVVGDSLGNFSVVSALTGQILAREKPGDCEAIWQLNCWKLTDKRCLIIVGAENCTWYAYQYNEKKEEITMTLLYKNQNKDFQAGITSITSVEREYLDGKYICLGLIIGSYDESIQSYEVKVDFQDDKLFAVTVDHQGKISIPGGGIWRTKPFTFWGDKEDVKPKQRLLVAAMYAGTFAIDCVESPETLKLSSATPVKALVDLDKLELPHKPLHYGVGLSDSSLVVCIADFNNSLCLLAPLDVRTI